MTQITDLLYDFELACFAVANEQSGPTEKAEWQSTKAALLASLSHTMGVKGLDPDESLCGLWIKNGCQMSSALTPTQQPEPVAWQWSAYENGEQATSWMPDGYGDKAGWQALEKQKPAIYQVVMRPLYALASQQAVPGWNEAIDAAAKVARQYGDTKPQGKWDAAYQIADLIAALNAEVNP